MTDVSSAPRVPGKRGRKAASHRPDLLLHKFRGRAAAAPASADLTQGLSAFGMLGNDQHSDCGPAATEHLRMLKALLTVATGVATFESGFVLPTEAHTLSWYFAYGVAQGEPGPDPDDGVDNASMLQYLYDVTEGKVPTPSGDDVEEWAFVEVDASDRNEICAAMVDFNGVLVGCCLTDDAESDFAATPPIPWTVTAQEEPDPNDGHDIAMCAYDEDSETFITWGAPQPATVAWETGEEGRATSRCGPSLPRRTSTTESSRRPSSTPSSPSARAGAPWRPTFRSRVGPPPSPPAPAPSPPAPVPPVDPPVPAPSSSSFDVEVSILKGVGGVQIPVDPNIVTGIAAGVKVTRSVTRQPCSPRPTTIRASHSSASRTPTASAR